MEAEPWLYARWALFFFCTCHTSVHGGSIVASVLVGTEALIPGMLNVNTLGLKLINSRTRPKAVAEEPLPPPTPTHEHNEKQRNTRHACVTTEGHEQCVPCPTQATLSETSAENIRKLMLKVVHAVWSFYPSQTHHVSRKQEPPDIFRICQNTPQAKVFCMYVNKQEQV